MARLLIAGFVIALAVGCTLWGPPRQVLAVGRPAPSIQGTDAEGKHFASSDYSNRVVMLSFWGSFCAPCRGLFKHERAIVEHFVGKPFVLLGVNADADAREVLRVQQENGLTWRSWHDGPAGPIAKQWGITCFPTIVLIDHEGIIRYRHEGAPDPVDLERRIEELVQAAEVKRR